MQDKEFEAKMSHLEFEFNKLEPGERVRFFYMYAKLLLDEQELKNLAKLLDDNTSK